MQENVNKKIRIGLISTDWNINEYRKKHNLYGGVGYYRIMLPYKNLIDEKFDVDFYNREFVDLSKKYDDNEEGINKFYDDFTKKYDIIITKAIDNPIASSYLCFYSQRNNCKLIIDLDDNYYEVLPDQPGYKYYHDGSQKRAFLGAYLSQVDGIICSTEPLARYYADRVKKVFNKDVNTYIFPNFNNLEEFNFKTKKKHKNIVIGWAGSITHDNDLKLVLPSLNNVLKKYNNVEFHIVGGVDPKNVPNVLAYFDSNTMDRVTFEGGTQAWKGYPKKLMELDWDIGICPLLDNEFNRGKSHIKWMEYSMKKIPTVASKTYPYYKPILGKDVIRDGETGFLAIDGLDFEKKLSFLIEHRDVAKKIGENAYNQVKDEWQITDNIIILEDILNKIYDTK